MSNTRAAKLSRLLFLRLLENRWTKRLERTLRESPPGGILLAEPLPRSMHEVPELLAKIRAACSGPVFIAIRQEGGEHDPLSRYFPALPSQQTVAGRGPAAVELVAGLMGKAMRMLGFNTNFAPCLDLDTKLHASAGGFGWDTALIGACGESFVRGLASHKVLACAKHFPGEGSVQEVAADQLPVSAKPMAELWREDLLPFRKVLPQLPMVLMSAASFKAYDFDIPQPASLSPALVDGLLRKKLGYHGLALAYDLESARVRGALSFGEAVVQSLSAGCDMVIVDQGEAFETGLQTIAAGIESERLSLAHVKESLRRISVALKRVPPPRKISEAALKRLHQQFERFAKEFGHA